MLSSLFANEDDNYRFENFFCQFLNRCNEYNYTNASLFLPRSLEIIWVSLLNFLVSFLNSLSFFLIPQERESKCSYLTIMLKCVLFMSLSCCLLPFIFQGLKIQSKTKLEHIEGAL